jgi:AraC-like DNA-binding protein
MALENLPALIPGLGPKQKKHHKKKMGRPRVEIDWNIFENLCGIQCTLEEMAAVFHCSIDHLEKSVKREYKKTFSEIFNEKRCYGKMSLRRRQWKAALDGNTTMMIWLGKQHLEQADRLEEIIPSAAHTLRVVYGEENKGNGEDTGIEFKGFGINNPLARSSSDSETNHREQGEA